MKTRMNVTKKEAEQLGWNAEFIRTDNAHFSIKDGSFVFWSGNGGACGILNHKNKYKDYEWRLTDLCDLEQGDLILLTGGFDKYYRKNYVLAVFDKDNYCWQIRENRPETIKIFCNVYKLFKKSDKK
jgi:hypothetical protein